DVGEEVGDAGGRILPLLDVPLNAAEEGVLADVGNQLPEDARTLVVGDGVEVQVDRLDVWDVGGNRVGGRQLILTPGAGFVLIGKRDPSVLEAGRFHLGEHRHEGGEALVQPE